MEFPVPVFKAAHKVESKRIYEGDIVNFRVDKVRLEDGQETIRELVEHNGGVVIACQPAEDKVVLISQYRYSVDEDLLELPAGRIEIGEDPLHAATRELTEETGYRAKIWRELVRMYSAPGFCNEMLYMFHASEVELVSKNLDYDEETEVIVLDTEDAWQLVLDGKIRDAKTVSGIGMLLAEKYKRIF
ncbi:MAG: NUDIX hydrolase [Candidatus Melainabacteria bacterium]|nr:MAG: NUDIX hydrolase [Candidatus Melainabacteria bacterium]